MAIYLGTTKLTGTGVQVDDALSSTSTNPVENKAVTSALTDLGYSEWQKPADWIDIRSGAIPNSIYFLVAHSSDYATYPEFKFRVDVSTSGHTYDVFVDGSKIATTTSASATTLNWQTLALTTGWDITTPSTLKAHIVRVTPTTSTDTITKFLLQQATARDQGVLWTHFTTSSVIDLATAFCQGSSTNYLAPVLQAITCSTKYLLVARFNNGLRNCQSVQYVCPLEWDGITQNGSLNSTFYNTQIKRLYLKGFKNTADMDNGAFCSACHELEEVITDDCYLAAGTDMFKNCFSLKRIPNINAVQKTTFVSFLTNAPKLENTFLDFSNCVAMTNLGVYGTSSYFIDGLKGVIVSSSAPFSNATAPQINVSYTGLDRTALVALFNSLPTVTDSQVCNVTGCTGADDLTAEDLAISTGKGWSISR